MTDFIDYKIQEYKDYFEREENSRHSLIGRVQLPIAANIALIGIFFKLSDSVLKSAHVESWIAIALIVSMISIVVTSFFTAKVFIGYKYKKPAFPLRQQKYLEKLEAYYKHPKINAENVEEELKREYKEYLAEEYAKCATLNGIQSKKRISLIFHSTVAIFISSFSLGVVAIGISMSSEEKTDKVKLIESVKIDNCSINLNGIKKSDIELDKVLKFPPSEESNETEVKSDLKCNKAKE